MALTTEELSECLVALLRNASDPAATAKLIVQALNEGSEARGIKMTRNFCIPCCIFLETVAEIEAHRAQHMQLQEAIGHAQALHQANVAAADGHGN